MELKFYDDLNTRQGFLRIVHEDIKQLCKDYINSEVFSGHLNSGELYMLTVDDFHDSASLQIADEKNRENPLVDFKIQRGVISKDFFYSENSIPKEILKILSEIRLQVNNFNEGKRDKTIPESSVHL